MSNVELCLDLAGLIQPASGDILVGRVSDYAAAYAAMARALHLGQPMRVLVRHRACAEWLRHAHDKYGSGLISLVQTSYRSLLEARWGVHIPAWVPDGDLIASKLLERPSLQAAPGQSFEDLVLEAFWGPVFTYRRLPLNHIAELANGFDVAQWRASMSVPVASAVLARQLAQWENEATLPGEQMLIATLRETPEKLASLLSQLRVLRGYPQEVGLRCVGEDYAGFAPLRLDLTNLAVDSSALVEVAKQVQVHLQGVIRSGVDESTLADVLGQMSGVLMGEFDWVEGVLKSGAVVTSRALLDRIGNVFRPIGHRIASRLADLELLIEPPRSSVPSATWGTEQWVGWAVREYLPYRFWLENKGVLDEEMAQYADQYADWLYGHFAEFIGSYSRLTYRAIANLKDTLKGGEVLLFVILDNLSFRYASELRSLMQARGYGSADPIAYVSMLPSATVVSKKAMVAGDPSPFSGTAYKKVVEDTWQRQFGRKTKYLGRVGDLQTLSTREHEFYVLNYTPIDDALHSDPGLTGISHTEAVRQALANLAESIHTFALRFGIEDSLRVVVCSDHGSTLIPADTPNVIDAELIAKRVDDVHHRYVALTDQELDALPQSVLDQCYCFRGGVFQLDATYLAARGYGRFRKGDSAGYMHGGLTPEETLVPYMVFQRAHVAVQKPTVRLLDKVFRYGVRSRVRLEVVNPNPLPLQKVQVEIVQPEGTAKPYVADDPIEVNGVSQLMLDNVRFREAQGEIKEITVRLIYECGAQERRNEYVLPVAMKRLMTSSFDLNL